MSTSDAEAEAIPEGLRERRRRQTLRDVSDAAIELFERQGVAATTVDEIARTAGIAQRTFFRYYPTKEDAAFPDDEGFATVVRETVAAVHGGTPVAAAMDGGWQRLFGEFDARPEKHARALRVRRLLQHEPTLLARALAGDAEHVDALTDAAVDAAGADADVLTVRASIALVSTLARLAFDEWARRAEDGEAASIHDIYLELRPALAEIGLLASAERR